MRVERERYFQELGYLELSALYAGPLKPAALARWTVAPRGALGLVAPFSLTHRAAPIAPKLWPHDATTGEFRDGPHARTAIAALAAAIAALGASRAVFRSPDGFSPSAANRDQLRRFFAEVAPREALGGADRVWLPGGLWEVRSAAKLAAELDVCFAFDPLVREPGVPPEVHEDLEAPRIYLRPENAGRTGTLRPERIDDLAMLVEHYEDRPLVIAFATPERWADARNLRKLLDAR
ncbi:MAG TPA: hypothetical protein VLX92_17445 [Kofleriaceae bacterium]|nr:hypothetical protein [Kofleriaceae bacterium]